MANTHGRRPDKIAEWEIYAYRIRLRRRIFIKKTQKLIKKILLLKTLKNIVILHIINKL